MQRFSVERAGPMECMPDYNRVRAAMYWLRLWTPASTSSCTLDTGYSDHRTIL